MLGAFLFGYLLAGSSHPTVEAQRISPTHSDEVYLNTNAIQRVKDPLQIITTCSGSLVFARPEDVNGEYWDNGTVVSKRDSFLGVFKRTSNNPEKYEILRIVRVLDGADSSARFWFEFIEKDKLESAS
jgi:hypothetical protein